MEHPRYSHLTLFMDFVHIFLLRLTQYIASLLSLICLGEDYSPSDGANDYSPSDGANDYSPSDGANDYSPSDGANDYSPLQCLYKRAYKDIDIGKSFYLRFSLLPYSCNMVNNKRKLSGN